MHLIKLAEHFGHLMVIQERLRGLRKLFFFRLFEGNAFVALRPSVFLVRLVASRFHREASGASAGAGQAKRHGHSADKTETTERAKGSEASTPWVCVVEALCLRAS